MDLYAHIKETAITSAIAMVITLAFFWFLGQPGDFDASDKVAAMQGVFHITPWLFLPLVVVVVLALFRFPPFTTIFMGALAGGVMAVIVAPERVAAYAGARDGVPHALALVKGVWLALADGYKLSSGQPTVDTLVTRGGMESMLNTIWLIIVALAFGGVIEKIGALDRLIAPVLAAAKSTGALVTSLVGGDSRDEHRDGGSVHRRRAAGADVQGRVREARIRAGRPVALDRRYGHADGRADPLEQLRRVHGGDARRCDA